MTSSWKPRLKKDVKPLYLSIVQSLADDLTSGVLMTGTRLPTHRELAESLNVAIGTITRAYVEAEKIGLIHSEGRRGTFVGESRLGSTGSGGPYEQSSHLIDLQRFYPFFGSDPDLAATLRKLARSSSIQWLLHYVPFSGLQRHRETGVSWIKKLGLDVDPESIVITSGAHNAVFLILASTLQKGDIIVTDSHTYPGFNEIIRFLELIPLGVPIDNNGIIPKELEQICSREKVKALYCNPTLHNPTATTLTKSRRYAVASLADKYGFFIIENEINRPLMPDPPPLIKSITPNRCYLVASVSKIVSAGLRVCFVICPPDSVNNLNNAAHAALYNVSPLLLEILTLWLNDGTVDTTIERRRLETLRRHNLLQEILGSQYNVNSNPYGYFAWLSLPQNWSSYKFVAEVRSRGILISPAESFVVKGCEPLNAVRICMGANTNQNSLRQALNTLAEILDNPSSSSTLFI